MDYRKTKGAALVIPQLPRCARERGVVKLPHTPEQGCEGTVYRQVCAAPVLPFAATMKPLRRAGSAAPDASETGVTSDYLSKQVRQRIARQFDAIQSPGALTLRELYQPFEKVMVKLDDLAVNLP
jgi:hypothetical protein